MSMNGIDISSHQTGINLSAVPCDFVIIKATQGISYVNPDCNRAYQQAKKAGKCLGVYHYAGGGGAVAEADFFLENIGGYIGEAILVLDWESYQNNAYSQGPAYAKRFLDRVYQQTGVKPLVYTSKSVCREYDWSAVAGADYGLWVAQYANYNQTGYQSDPWTDNNGYGAWKSPAIFQYSSAGRLTGYAGDLDLNIAYMDKNAWAKYAAKNGVVQNTVGADTSAHQQQVPESTPSNAGDPGIVFTYAVKLTDGTILPAVTNLSDYAGLPGKTIAGIAIKVNKGSVKYRVHVKGKGWLPYVTGYDWNDINNGWAGYNGAVIDAVEIYYNTPADIVAKYGYQKAQYRVAPIGGGYYAWQYDNETGNGQDGYAGAFGIAFDRFQLF